MYDSLINVNGEQVPTLEILLLLTVVALLPSLIIMMTSFSRTVIILSFLRNALGNSADSTKYGFGRNLFIFNAVYHGSGTATDQYRGISAL